MGTLVNQNSNSNNLDQKKSGTAKAVYAPAIGTNKDSPIREQKKKQIQEYVAIIQEDVARFQEVNDMKKGMMLDNLEKNITNNAILVKNNLFEQTKDIKDRLAARKKNKLITSFHNRTMGA